MYSKSSKKHRTQKKRIEWFYEAFRVKFNALFDLPILGAAPIDFPSPS